MWFGVFCWFRVVLCGLGCFVWFGVVLGQWSERVAFWAM